MSSDPQSLNSVNMSHCLLSVCLQHCGHGGSTTVAGGDEGKDTHAALVWGHTGFIIWVQDVRGSIILQVSWKAWAGLCFQRVLPLVFTVR